MSNFIFFVDFRLNLFIKKLIIELVNGENW